MNIFQRYIEYVKDNPNGYWFKQRIWGWGWTPVTWQGWLVTGVFVVLIVWNASRIDSMSHSASDTLFGVVPQTLALVALFLGIAWKKGEPLKWRWGFPKKNDTSNPKG